MTGLEMVFKFLGKQRSYSQCFEALVCKTTEESLLYVAGMIIVIYGLHTMVLRIIVFVHKLSLSDFLKILELAIWVVFYVASFHGIILILQLFLF